MGTPPILPGGLPAELLDAIFRGIYESYQPAPSFDAALTLRPPRLVNGMLAPGQQISFEDPLYTQALRTLSAVCLVCRDWAAAGQPWLFRHVRVEVPRAFEALLEAIAEPEEEERMGRSPGHGRGRSPPRSRTSSRSPTRGRNEPRYASIDDAMRRLNVAAADMSRTSSVEPRPIPSDRLPGLFIERLTFSSFRTVGMRRTIREGSQQRFITTDRVLRLLQGTRGIGILSTDGESPLDAQYDLEPNEEEWGQLKGVGMTEYMDSALQLEVLDELLLRGGVEIGPRDAPKRIGSPAALACTPLVALDLCGCVSSRFVGGMGSFIEAHKLGTPDGIRFPYVRRLGMASVTIDAALLESFMASFPRLTHLDLSNSRATPKILRCLTDCAPGMRLVGLSLARCKGLTSESVRDFLLGEMQLDGHVRNVTADLIDLSLYGDETLPNPLTAAHLAEVITTAPCFLSGRMRFLDLSSACFTEDLLALLPSQPALRDFGFAGIRAVSLPVLSRALATTTPILEILDITQSCFPAGARSTADILSLHQHLVNGGPPTLRVIELDEPTLRAIKGGVGKWKVIWPRGRRAFYIDTEAQGPEMQAVLMAIVKDERLAPSILGWHARKMESASFPVSAEGSLPS